MLRDREERRHPLDRNADLTLTDIRVDAVELPGA
jgi:hypothetical protein